MENEEKKDIVEFDKNNDPIEDFQMYGQQFFIFENLSCIDVLDENLYSYDNAVFNLTTAIQDRASEGLFRKIEQFINSAPAIQKAREKMRTKTEFFVRHDLIPDEIKNAMKQGKAEIIPCKDSENTFFLQIRATIDGLIIDNKEYGKNRKIKDIILGTKSIPVDITGAMQCLSKQNQLNQISNGLNEISEVCELNFERLIQGQRDDRIAALFSSRSKFIQSLALTDDLLQRNMLIQAICAANSARAELALQIKSDILSLAHEKKLKAKDAGKIVDDIRSSIVAINNAVQLSLYSYQVLGEIKAQLAVVKDHMTFIKQVLLKNIEYNGNKAIAWLLISSFGNNQSPSTKFEELPEKLLFSCETFIANTKIVDSPCYLEEKSNVQQ